MLGRPMPCEGSSRPPPPAPPESMLRRYAYTPGVCLYFSAHAVQILNSFASFLRSRIDLFFDTAFSSCVVCVSHSVWMICVFIFHHFMLFARFQVVKFDVIISSIDVNLCAVITYATLRNSISCMMH